jgi:hypothetical protein
MKYELPTDNLNCTDDELINDLKAVATKMGKTEITRSEYQKLGRYSESTLRKRFGGWIKVIEKAGLNTKRGYYSDDEMIKEMQRISRNIDSGTLSKSIFDKSSMISNPATIEKRFGTWINALEKAGIRIASSQKRYSEEELFINIEIVWEYHGKKPNFGDMNENPSKISGNTYLNHFGTWRKALECFIKYENDGITNEVDNNQVYINNENKKVHRTKRTINTRIRFIVMKRDNFKCKICGRSPATHPGLILHVDHIKPWSEDGETVLENLQTLCSDDNLGKSNLSM